MVVDNFEEMKKKRGPKKKKKNDKAPENPENETENPVSETENPVSETENVGNQTKNPETESVKKEESQPPLKKVQPKKIRTVVVLIGDLYNHKDGKNYKIGEQVGDEVLIKLAEEKRKNDQGKLMVEFWKDKKRGS